MKHTRPWYRQDRNAWYCEPLGKRVCLGPHPEGAPKPVRSKKTGLWNVPQPILDAFHTLMTTQPTQRFTLQGDEAVCNVLDDFLTYVKEEKAPRTADRYCDFIQDFINAQDEGVKFGLLDVSQLTSRHVTTWLNQHTKWGPTTKRNAITALMAAFNWGVTNHGLDKNPIKGMKKPEAQKRLNMATPEDVEAALKHASPEFRDLLVVSYDTGARPFEIKQLEARHLQLDKKRALIPKEEAKGRKKARVFYFPTDRSLEVVERLSAERPQGKLFLNTKGRPWTGFSVKNAFERIEKKTGKRLQHYGLRHGRLTDWLVSGVDSHVVAKLAGHSNSAMIDSTYSHVQEDYEFMLENAKKQTRPPSSKSDA